MHQVFRWKVEGTRVVRWDTELLLMSSSQVHPASRCFWELKIIPPKDANRADQQSDAEFGGLYAYPGMSRVAAFPSKVTTSDAEDRGHLLSCTEILSPGPLLWVLWKSGLWITRSFSDTCSLLFNDIIYSEHISQIGLEMQPSDTVRKRTTLQTYPSWDLIFKLASGHDVPEQMDEGK